MTWWTGGTRGEDERLVLRAIMRVSPEEALQRFSSESQFNGFELMPSAGPTVVNARTAYSSVTFTARPASNGSHVIVVANGVATEWHWVHGFLGGTSRGWNDGKPSAEHPQSKKYPEAPSLYLQPAANTSNSRRRWLAGVLTVVMVAGVATVAGAVSAGASSPSVVDTLKDHEFSGVMQTVGSSHLGSSQVWLAHEKGSSADTGTLVITVVQTQSSNLEPMTISFPAGQLDGVVVSSVSPEPLSIDRRGGVLSYRFAAPGATAVTKYCFGFRADRPGDFVASLRIAMGATLVASGSELVVER